MVKTIKKSATQTLFDRILRTWVIPEVESRAQAKQVEKPFVLILALVIWEPDQSHRVMLNDEVGTIVTQMEFVNSDSLVRGQAIECSHIQGIGAITVLPKYRTCPFILVVQGKQGMYYVASHLMARIIGKREFEILREPLSKEGVKLPPNEYQMNVYLDVIRNGYEGLPPGLKRRQTLDLGRLRTEQFRRTAIDRVKRHLRLPTLLVHPDDEFLSLLLEARETYIDGYFFSCIASAATTADRICNLLAQRYRLPLRLQKWVLGETLGNKIYKLCKEGVINKRQLEVLLKINRIRVRHLHPKSKLSKLTLKRDALAALTLLHELLESTFSVYTDHTFDQGRMVPKSLI